jgi:hypothetical protein
VGLPVFAATFGMGRNVVPVAAHLPPRTKTKWLCILAKGRSIASSFRLPLVHRKALNLSSKTGPFMTSNTQEVLSHRRTLSSLDSKSINSVSFNAGFWACSASTIKPSSVNLGLLALQALSLSKTVTASVKLTTGDCISFSMALIMDIITIKPNNIVILLYGVKEAPVTHSPISDARMFTNKNSKSTVLEFSNVNSRRQTSFFRVRTS